MTDYDQVDSNIDFTEKRIFKIKKNTDLLKIRQ